MRSLAGFCGPALIGVSGVISGSVDFVRGFGPMSIVGNFSSGIYGSYPCERK